jgi:hypothetical protein
MPSLKKVAFATTLLAVLIVLVYARKPSVDAPPVAAVSKVQAEARSSATIPGSQESTPAASNETRAQVVSTGLSAKVKALAASSEPRDAFTAFHILSQCKLARDEERQYQLTKQSERDPERAWLVQAGVVGAKAIEKACGDLDESDFRDRIVLVERAAEAGVPMAAIRLANEGPWGDESALHTRWDDPVVQEWRQKVIRLTHLAARKGDVASLSSLQAQYEDGAGLIAEKNPELALQFAVAKHMVYEAQTGRKMIGAKRELEDMTAALTADAAARARSAGELLAKEATGGRGK